MQHRNHHLLVRNGFLTKYGVEEFMCKITKTVRKISKYNELKEDSLDSKTKSFLISVSIFFEMSTVTEKSLLLLPHFRQYKQSITPIWMQGKAVHLPHALQGKV